jgi:hypothetical protein
MKNIHAFPRPHSGTTNFSQEGMTLRDYFAAKALPLAMQMKAHNYNKEMGKEWEWDIEEDALDFAQAAYAFADAMLEAREE